METETIPWSYTIWNSMFAILDTVLYHRLTTCVFNYLDDAREKSEKGTRLGDPGSATSHTIREVWPESCQEERILRTNHYWKLCRSCPTNTTDTTAVGDQTRIFISHSGIDPSLGFLSTSSSLLDSSWCEAQEHPSPHDIPWCIYGILQCLSYISISADAIPSSVHFCSIPVSRLMENQPERGT